MITQEAYLEIKNNPQADNLPILMAYNNLVGKIKFKKLENFNMAFSEWLARSGELGNLGYMIQRAYKKLDEHFNLNS